MIRGFQTMTDNKDLLGGERVISATRTDEEFLAAIKEGTQVIFDLGLDLMNVSAKVKKAHEAGKLLFVHIDLAKGIGKDESGIRFLKRVGVDGVISTKVGLIRISKEMGLHTVLRFFIVDSQSVATTVEAVRSAKPDLIEIMPGIVPKIVGRLKGMVSIPIVAGGLIETEEETREMLKAGAFAVSTGNRDLWRLKI